MRRLLLVTASMGLLACLWAPASLGFGPVPGSPFATAVGPYRATFLNGGSRLSTYNQDPSNQAETVSTFTVDASTGALTQIAGSPFTWNDAADSIASNGTRLSSSYGDPQEANGFTAYSIDQQTGVPSEIASEQGGAGQAPVGTVLNRTGDLIAVDSVDFRGVEGGPDLYSVNQRTHAFDYVDSFGLADSGTTFSPDGHFMVVVAPDTAGSTRQPEPGHASVLTIDPTTKRLTPVPGSPFPVPNSGFAVFSPDGSELAILGGARQTDDTGAMYSFDRATGAIAEWPGMTLRDYSFGGRFNRDGSRLAVATTSGRTAVYAVDRAVQSVSQVHGSPFEIGGGAPIYSPDGSLLVVPDGTSDHVAVWSTAVGPPTATIASPPTGGSYILHQQVATSFSCAAPTGGTVASCVDSNGAAGGTGALATSKAGSHTYTVTATDDDGQTGKASITYTVIGAPTAKITAPASGQAYEPGQTVSTNFTCTEAAGGPGIATCTDSNGSGNPGRLATNVAGVHNYTVTATSSDGLSTVAKLSYRVIGPPAVKITRPASKQVVNRGQVVASSFVCTPATRGPAVTKCLDSTGHASPGTLDTSKAGGHRYSVTATAADGQTHTASVSYYVAGPPTASVSAPAANGRYLRDSRVLAAYACAEGKFGPGLASCVGPTANGGAIDTSTPGQHRFVVTAVSRDGQRGTATINYTVVRPSNVFSISHVTLGRKGVLRLWVTVPGPGRLTIGERAQVKRSWRNTFLFTRAHRRARSAEVKHLTVRPNRHGRRYVRHLTRRLVLALYISYTPTGGVTGRHPGIIIKGPSRR